MRGAQAGAKHGDSKGRIVDGYAADDAPLGILRPVAVQLGYIRIVV